MSDTLAINETNFLSAGEAGKRFGYTGTYMIMLAKDGKIDGKKIGNRWYVDPSSVERFVSDSKKVREVRSELISKARREELALRQHEEKTTSRTKALVETLAILVIGLTIGAVGYLGSDVSQHANVSGANQSFVERFAVAFFEFFSPQQTTMVKEITVTGNTGDDLPTIAVGTTTHTSLVIGPGEVMNTTTVESIRNSFSDEVSVSLDPDNPDTGIIIPHFRAKEGEAYRFLMVPVEADSTSGKLSLPGN